MTKNSRRKIFHVILMVIVLAVAALAAWFGAGFLEGVEEIEEQRQFYESQPEQERGESLAQTQPPPTPEQTGASLSEEGDQPTPEPDPVQTEAAHPDDVWRLILVSPSHPVGINFTPPQLETISAHHQVDSRIAGSLREMIASAAGQGIDLIVTSAYRPAERQSVLHNQQIDRFLGYGRSREEAVAAASTIVLPPGTSEHQTGLAVDIVTPEHQALTEAFADTPAGIWLAANAHRYGFILRYPRDTMHITGVIFEPWHFRYVGREHARAIFERGITLEEYLAR